MKDLQEEIKRRRQARRTTRTTSWTSLILRILLLAFVLIMIRFFANPDPSKFHRIIDSSPEKATEDTENLEYPGE